MKDSTFIISMVTIMIIYFIGLKYLMYLHKKNESKNRTQRKENNQNIRNV